MSREFCRSFIFGSRHRGYCHKIHKVLGAYTGSLFKILVAHKEILGASGNWVPIRQQSYCVHISMTDGPTDMALYRNPYYYYYYYYYPVGNRITISTGSTQEHPTTEYFQRDWSFHQQVVSQVCPGRISLKSFCIRVRLFCKCISLIIY